MKKPIIIEQMIPLIDEIKEAIYNSEHIDSKIQIKRMTIAEIREKYKPFLSDEQLKGFAENNNTQYNKVFKDAQIAWLGLTPPPKDANK